LWGFLIVGINDKGGLAGFQWQYVHSENFGFRETTIKSLANGSYSWRSDKPVSLVNPSFAIDDSAKEGKFWFSESESSLPTITSSKELFAQWPGLPPRQPLNKLSHEEALALELPPQVPHDFPSPFATEGQQVASVPEAAASASTSTSTPATTTATTTPVDPLVGVWVRTGSDIAWTNECWLLVGQTEDGVLIGKAQDSTRQHRRNFSDEGKNIHFQDGYAFGLKEISFERQSKMNYLWSSKANPFKSLRAIDPAMTGRISIQLNEQGPDYLASKGLLCRKRQSQSPARFRRLNIAEALELTLHPDLLKDFPSPFQEGTQWSGDVVTEVTGATQATGAPEDPSESPRR